MISGVIKAEDGAIAQYEKIIKLSDQVDLVTQDLCVTIIGDKEEHRRPFVAYLTEFERKSR